MPATRPCKYCENPVAINARRCPKCGGKKPYPHTPLEVLAGGVVGVALILTCCVWLPNWGSNPSNSPSTSHSTNREAARNSTPAPRQLPEAIYAKQTIHDQ